ncbi:MAG: hypothetical protein EOP56_11690 [Sphingobacteriales bacterium]|nr:MAG: hypothetical protein EOP56_11690 [Sphingobacteriales bacterium]
MQAMLYEYLIRRVYSTGRNYNKGADADIYRDMDTHYRDLETKSMYRTQEEREYEYQKRFAKVRRHVAEAIRDGIDKIRHSISEQDLKTLHEFESLLTSRFDDKVMLDNIINKATDVFHANGLNV